MKFSMRFHRILLLFLLSICCTIISAAQPTLEHSFDVRHTQRALYDIYSYGTPENANTNLTYLRQKAVHEARRLERELVIRTGQGTRPWTLAEKEELIKTGKVKGYQGHHINNVKDHPNQAGDPDNIRFLRRDEHYRAHHGGRNTVKTTGTLIDRRRLIQIHDQMSSIRSLTSAVTRTGIGIVILYHSIPRALEDIRLLRGQERYSRQSVLNLGQSGSMTISGGLFVTSGAARGLGFILARAQIQNMHAVLPVLRNIGRYSGAAALVMILVSEGFYTLQWYEGHISTRVYVKKTGGLAGGLAGAYVGAKIGALAGAKIGASIGSAFGPAGPAIGGAVGGTIGGTGGLVGGFVAGCKSVEYGVDYIYEKLDEERKKEYQKFVYEYYGCAEL